MDWVFIGIIALMLWGPFSIWLLHRAARSTNTIWVIIISILFVAINIGAGFLMLWTFGGAFGPGVLISCGYVPVFFISASIWLFISINIKDLEVSKTNKRLFIIFSGLVVASQLLPSGFGYYGTRIICGNKTERIAEPIVNAIKAYQEDNGEYPTELDLLIPQYIDEIPQPACYSLNYEYPFDISIGMYNYHLYTQLPGGGFYYCYSFDDQIWYSYSFLDGVCSDRPPETTP